jgi:uncharacterized GH25 family protein
MHKRVISSSVLLTLVLVSAAEECWLEPERFRCAIGEEIKVDFQTGENFVGGSWNGKQNKAAVVQWLSVSGVKDLSKETTPTRGNNVALKVLQEGTQMVAMETNTLPREWGAGKFEPYLEDNGLHDIVDARKKAGVLEGPVKEECTRYAKVLVQVGEKTDDTYMKKAGLRLEIIPKKNPYTLKTGDHLQCLVLYEGKPSPHTLVKVWSRLNHTTFLQNIYTEDDGTIIFPISTKGAWMVSTVKMVPGEKPGIGWHSMWGSLVFGI